MNNIYYIQMQIVTAEIKVTYKLQMNSVNLHKITLMLVRFDKFWPYRNGYAIVCIQSDYDTVENTMNIKL